MKGFALCAVAVHFVPLGVTEGGAETSDDIILQVTAPDGAEGWYCESMVANARTLWPHYMTMRNVLAKQRGQMEHEVTGFRAERERVFFLPNCIEIPQSDERAEELHGEVEAFRKGQGFQGLEKGVFPSPGMNRLGHFTSVGQLKRAKELNASGRTLGDLSKSECAFAPKPPPPPALNKELQGQPCIQHLDAMGRPALSIHFAVRPADLVCAEHAADRLLFRERRLAQEQTLVSGPWNALRRPRFSTMHASHLGRHAFCGSPFRGNLTPASEHCNVHLIGTFEKSVDHLAKAYTTSPFAAAISYVVESRYDPELALRFICGAGERNRWLKYGGMPPAAAALATYAPVYERRILYIRRGDAWQEAHSQVYDLNALFCGAADMLEGRFDAASLGADHPSLRLLERARYKLVDSPDVAAANEALCEAVARCAPGGPAHLGRLDGAAKSLGLVRASDWYKKELAGADRVIPALSSGVKAIDELVLGASSILAKDPLDKKEADIILNCAEKIAGFPVDAERRRTWLRELMDATASDVARGFVQGFHDSI